MAQIHPHIGRVSSQLVLPHVDPAHLDVGQLAGEIARVAGYATLRALPDGTIVALASLLYTTALFVDVSRDGWGCRFRFDSPAPAIAAFDAMRTGDDFPVGFIAVRTGPEQHGTPTNITVAR
jgi:hypothetical protein